MVQRMSPQLWASFEGQDGFKTESAPLGRRCSAC